jgi:hypothetical protein
LLSLQEKYAKQQNEILTKSCPAQVGSVLAGKKPARKLLCRQWDYHSIRWKNQVNLHAKLFCDTDA